MAPVIIALDAMGGDIGPAVVVPAALEMITKHSHLKIILVGDAEAIQLKLRTLKQSENSQLSIIHASQQVSMDDSPPVALRSKKDSSMRVAINLVKEGQAHACVSAGNTGALMAIARFVLKTLPGIDRPAILARIPTQNEKPVYVLDMGANVDSTPDFLLQFSVMGSVLVKAVENISNPSVGLLNIGHEDIKGNELVKETAQLLQKTQGIHYVGYIEADEVFQGKVDIVVCDGFVGNVALKASEGTAKLIAYFIKESFRQNWFTKLAGLVAMPVLQVVKKQIDPSRYNGASLLGLKGIVIKSHGGANIMGFANAIEAAMCEVEKNVPQLISEEVSKILSTEAQASTV